MNFTYLEMILLDIVISVEKRKTEMLIVTTKKLIYRNIYFAHFLLKKTRTSIV